MRRVLILEPSLVNERGHHAFATSRFVTLIGQQHCIVAAGSQWTGPQQFGTTPVKSLLRQTKQKAARLRRYGRLCGAALEFAQPLGTFLGKGRGPLSPPEFTTAEGDASTMRSLLTSDIRQCLSALGADAAADLVFMPSADAETAMGVAELLQENNNSPPFHLRLMYDDVGSHRTDATWRSALRVLANSEKTGGTPGKPRVRLLTETAAFAAAVEQIWGRSVDILPHPSDLLPLDPPTLGETFVIYIPGQLRSDKGLHLFSSIIDALATRRSSKHANVVVRVHGADVGIIGRNNGSVRVECLPAHIPEDDYVAYWRGAHAALLLHDPKIYGLRGSGVVCDAVACGRPFIFIEGASLGEWAETGNAISTLPDGGSVADAISQLIETYASRSEASAAAAARFPDVVRAGLKGLTAN